MTKYRLKKDTPEFKAGTVFDMIENIDVGKVLTMNAPREDAYAFEVDSIDNFDEWFEPLSDGWPQKGNGFWSISSDGTSFANIWSNDCYDNGRMDIGNVFKTEEAADRFANYLKAIATVRQDEGVLTPEQINERQGDSGLVYHVGSMVKQNGEEKLCGCVMDLYDVWAPLGTILFDTKEHAEASCKTHQDEWKIIANYDWSRE